MAEEDGQEVVFRGAKLPDDPLVALIKEARRRVQAGEGNAMLKEAEAGGDEAKWILVRGEVHLRMDMPREGREAAEKALAKYKDMANVRGQSVALQVIADCHLALHECSEVLALSIDAVSMCWELEDKSAEAAMMHTCAGAFQVQLRHAEAVRAATRAAALFREAGDKVGEAIALETAANASVSEDPSKGGPKRNNLLKEITGPIGGQGEMDAARFGQTSILYDKKPWQPISKFHPVLELRESLVGTKKEQVNPRLGPDGKPLFTQKQFGWGRPSHRLDQAFYHMVLHAGDKVL